MNTYSVFVGGEEFICRQFTDVDPDISGVEVKNALTGKLIGEIVNTHIPDIDDLDGDSEETIAFDKKIEKFVEENL